MSKQSNSDSVESRPVKLNILDKVVQIACKPGEEEDLAKAAAHVDKAMRELRARSTTSSIEKIAIVTAINTANTLLKTRTSQSNDAAIADQISNINAKLAELLVDE